MWRTKISKIFGKISVYIIIYFGIFLSLYTLFHTNREIVESFLQFETDFGLVLSSFLVILE